MTSLGFHNATSSNLLGTIFGDPNIKWDCHITTHKWRCHVFYLARTGKLGLPRRTADNPETSRFPVSLHVKAIISQGNLSWIQKSLEGAKPLVSRSANSNQLCKDIRPTTLWNQVKLWSRLSPEQDVIFNLSNPRVFFLCQQQRVRAIIPHKQATTVNSNHSKEHC